jgi:TatD DNase family protein
MWIDAHCHLADLRFGGDLDQVIDRSKKAKVDGWVQGGVCPEDWERQIQLQKTYGPRVWTAFGLHPWWVVEKSLSSSLVSSPAISEGLRELQEKIHLAQALGELGLDYSSRFRSNKEVQVEVFEKQLDIARQAGKPLIFHIVQAHGEAIEILKSWAPFSKGGIVHSFSGPFEVAKQYIDLGFLISVGGAATQRGFQTLKKTLTCLPLEKIVVETDSPDQKPLISDVGIRTEEQNSLLNEPAHLVPIARAIAKIRQMDEEEILSRSTKNIERLFDLLG